MKALHRLFVISSLLGTSATWAGTSQLNQALDQAHAAQASYQVSAIQEASEHTRAALGHVEILRRQHKTDKALKAAEADLKGSLKQYKVEKYMASSMMLDQAVLSLETFSEQP
jgi:hypothetical protein